MVTALALLGVLAVLFAAAVLSTREQDLLAEVGPDDADVALPTEPLTPDDVRRVRLSLAPRGYRMSQVDEVLERLAAELADRDRRIGLLEAAAEGAAPAVPPAVREAGVEDLPIEPPPAAAPVPPPAAEPAPALAPPPAPAPPLGSRTPEELSPYEIAGEAPEPAREPASSAYDAAGDAAERAAAPEPPPVERVVETIHVPPTPTTLAWSNPAAVPEFPVIDAPEADVPREPGPDPLPAADLGTDLVQSERRDEAPEPDRLQ